MSNNIQHPDHYNTDSFECIDVMEEVFGIEAVQTFCKLNAFKYLWRSDKKNGIEDIDKAAWYLNRLQSLEAAYEDDPDIDDDDDDDTEADTIGESLVEMFGNIGEALRKAIASVSEMDDPKSEVHKRFEIFKELKDHGYKDEVAFYHAFKSEVKDEQ